MRASPAANPTNQAVLVDVSTPVRSSVARQSCRRVLALLCAFTVSANASAAEIWVITDRAHPRAHPVKVMPGMRLIELDAPARIEAELAAQLPSDPDQATAIVQQRLAAGGPALQQRFVAAYQGVVDAWSLRVTKVPAVVIDRRYVVYGDPDVARALASIEKYRSTRP